MHKVTVLLLLLLATARFAFANEAEIKKALEAKFPQVKVDSVTKTPYFGLYEVFMDKQLFYTDEKVTYLFLGNIIDLKTRENVTEQRLAKLTAIPFESLPLDLAIKTVRGNGSRKVAVFSDPDCPYCKRLEKELANVTDVTIYTFLYPIPSLHPNAEQKAKAVWCSQERGKAWDDLMLRGIAPTASPTCANPVEKVMALGQKHRIFGTPTLIFPDGTVVPGAVPLAQLEKMLSETKTN
jgi:thiol:disulfide interchange protein DsbC